MIRPDRPAFRAICLSALALVLAATLSACGRKGGLDLPPAAAQAGQPGQPGVDAPPTVDAQGRPIAPRGPQRRLPIDFLLE
jgi:predicted small lipoprotein YifL